MNRHCLFCHVEFVPVANYGWRYRFCSWVHYRLWAKRRMHLPVPQLRRGIAR